jgi:hypothetical protein
MAEDKKAAALAKLAAAKAKREQAEQAGAEDREVANILRDAEVEEKLARAIAEHGVGRAGAIKVGPFGFVLVAPPRASYMRFLDSKNSKTSEDMLSLVSVCLYPKGAESTAEFTRALELYPALIAGAGDLVVKLSGRAREDDEGK